MAQFVAFDSNVEVSGRTILATVNAMGDRARTALTSHGLDNLDPNEWYPQQSWLDAFRELASGDMSAMFDLVSIGMSIPKSADWPPNIDTIESAIHSINEAYHINHRGGEIGYYRATQTGPREIEVECRNPYPCDFDYGIIYEVARMYQPSDGTVSVVPDETDGCRKLGDDACHYIVTW